VKVLTEFTVRIHEDGRVTANPIVDNPELSRSASELDIKQACQELLDAIHLKNISRVISAVITESQATEGQKVAKSVRESLVEKGLL